MLPENRIPTHPGEILLEEFLNPLGLSQVAFAGHIGVPVQRVRNCARQTWNYPGKRLALCRSIRNKPGILAQPAIEL